MKAKIKPPTPAPTEKQLFQNKIWLGPGLGQEMYKEKLEHIGSVPARCYQRLLGSLPTPEANVEKLPLAKNG